MRRFAIPVVLAALLASSGQVLAETPGSGHAGHVVSPKAEAASPASRAYREAMERMHAAMAELADTGDADIDFARGMIPHHQAAIDMARAELEHGTDPQLRKLAEAIIAAQVREIAELETWLRKRGVR